MMLEARCLSKRYSKGIFGTQEYAVNCVSFSLEDGVFCALVGESGSGKSTLARLLCGVLPPTKGTILLDGAPIFYEQFRKDSRLRSKIQMVLQDGKSALDPRFSVYRSIAEPLRNLKHLSRTEERKRIYQLMEALSLPFELAQRKAYELSGGQQKRVCIARALVAEPEIIIFDEAISGLDVLLQKNVLDLLKRLHSELSLSCLFITHDMDAALYLADRIMVMQSGVIVEDRSFSGNTECFTHPYSQLLLSSILPEQLSNIHRIYSPSGVLSTTWKGEFL